jgi:hypothetical protein
LVPGQFLARKFFAGQFFVGQFFVGQYFARTVLRWTILRLDNPSLFFFFSSKTDNSSPGQLFAQIFFKLKRTILRPDNSSPGQFITRTVLRPDNSSLKIFAHGRFFARTILRSEIFPRTVLRPENFSPDNSSLNFFQAKRIILRPDNSSPGQFFDWAIFYPDSSLLDNFSQLGPNSNKNEAKNCSTWNCLVEELST